MGQDRTDKDRTGAQPQHERVWARWRSGHSGCGLGLQLDYSTRRTVLAHDVTLGEGAGQLQLVCLPVCSFLHPTVVGPSPAGLRR